MSKELSAEWQQKIKAVAVDVSNHYSDEEIEQAAFFDGYMACSSQLVEAQERIKTLEDAMRLFIDNIDRWLETGIPATSEESKAIYDACKKALSLNTVKEKENAQKED